MRVLSGRFKNHLLTCPKGAKTRPTSSKVRASIFNILQSKVEGADFLDLFAGSGAMGIEALSRGAASATFVDCDLAATRCIHNTLKKLDLQARILRRDAFQSTKQLGQTFDIIYADPPYHLNVLPLVESLRPLLKPDGIALVEQSKKSQLHTCVLKLIDKRRFGDCVVYFYTL